MNRTRAWLRRLLGWSTSRRAWIERGAALALILTAIVAALIGRSWPLEGQLLLAGSWLLLFAVLIRHEAVRLAGPVFLYEVLRASRRRVHATRTLCALILFIVIIYIYEITIGFGRFSELGLREQAELANNLFLAFISVQMGVIGLLTPLMTAGAVAEEKERRTLEFVLATDLTSREIVLGKLGARSASMLLLLLVGLPVLAIMQFLGGIDPSQLLASGIVSIVSLFSVANLGLMLSTLLSRARDAIVSTFLVMGGYLILSALMGELRNSSLRTVNGVIDVVDVIQAGNPFIGFASLLSQLESGGDHSDVLREVVSRYAIFHVLIGTMCLAWSVSRLRPLALAQAGESRGKGGRRLRGLPPIGSAPMVWKEVFAEPGLRLHVAIRIALVLVILWSFWPPVAILINFWDEIRPFIEQVPFDSGDPVAWRNPVYRFQLAINTWVRVMSAIVGTSLLVAIGVRAAGSITGERARQTLDELLTTPLGNDEIINGKWIGSLLSIRLLALWIAAVYFIGMIGGGVSFLGIFAALAAWTGYAVFVAALGVWCSVNSLTTLRATVKTVVGGFFALGGHWLLSAFCCYIPVAVSGSRFLDDGIILPIGFQAGLTPPVMLAILPISSLRELEIVNDSEGITFLVASLAGPIVALFLGIILRFHAVQCFAQLFNRTDSRKPEIARRST